MTGTVAHATELATSVLGSTGEQGTALAQAEVKEVIIRITEMASLLTLQAGNVSSSASIEGTCCSGAALASSGSATLVDATLDCLIGAGIALPVNPAPNTEVLDSVGMRIVLNEQILEGDGHGSLSLTVNAIHIYLDAALVHELGAVDGEIIVGHSTASLDCDGSLASGLCVGDCNRNQVVTVNELVMGVNIALGNMEMEMCTAMDPSHDERATIDELIQAVFNLLFGCPGTRGER